MWQEPSVVPPWVGKTRVDKASSRYVQVIQAVLALTLSLLDDSGPSADTCFDELALSLLLSRYLSVNIHAKHLPLIPTQRLLVI